VRQVERFDQPADPVPRRGHRHGNGAPVVLDRGDLALALRSSMSVPGVFPPIEVDGRVLGDGGLVNNVPIDVARAMGADVVIVVNIGTPPGRARDPELRRGPDGQMINILTEQNVQRSLATLRPRDVLIAPAWAAELGRLRPRHDLHPPARPEREAQRPLAPLALAATDQVYAAWRAGSPRRPMPMRQRGASSRAARDQPGTAARRCPGKPARNSPSMPPRRARRRRLAAGGDYVCAPTTCWCRAQATGWRRPGVRPGGQALGPELPAHGPGPQHRLPAAAAPST
jgi:NTE family protein